MRCPICNAPSMVLSTRDLTRRRRECYNGHRFFTLEMVEPGRNQEPPMVSHNAERLTPQQIDAICEGRGHVPQLRNYVNLAGAARLGMLRHPEGSKDWGSHGLAWGHMVDLIKSEFGAEADDLIAAIQAAAGDTCAAAVASDIHSPGGGREFA